MQPESADLLTIHVGRVRNKFCKLVFNVSGLAATYSVCLTRALITKAMI